MSSDSFYSDIKSFSNLTGISETKNFHPIPPDWFIFICDVEKSTIAIANGRYKDVNLVGVSAISAVQNACKDHNFPFVFGGDGATFIVAPNEEVPTRNALVATQKMAIKEFGLSLRIAKFSVSELYTLGHMLNVGKYQVSKNLDLAVFSGHALATAKKLAKDSSDTLNPHLIIEESTISADFSGLECRWQPIPSTKGEILSVIVKTHENLSQEQESAIYGEVINEIQATIGSTPSQLMPQMNKNLKTTLNPLALLREQKIRTHLQSLSTRIYYSLALLLKAALSRILFIFRFKIAGVDWSKYRDDVVKNSDFWKYDEVLRFVADVSPDQKLALIENLQARRKKNEIYYGIHSSKSALMTCLVWDPNSHHVHFIDGGDGGYTLAAKQLKAQMAQQS